MQATVQATTQALATWHPRQLAAAAAAPACLQQQHRRRDAQVWPHARQLQRPLQEGRELGAVDQRGGAALGAALRAARAGQRDMAVHRCQGVGQRVLIQAVKAEQTEEAARLRVVRAVHGTQRGVWHGRGGGGRGRSAAAEAAQRMVQQPAAARLPCSSLAQMAARTCGPRKERAAGRMQQGAPPCSALEATSSSTTGSVSLAGSRRSGVGRDCW